MKKFAKRSLCGIVSLIFTFCLGGCNSTEKEEALMTVACFTDMHIMSGMLDMDNLTLRQSAVTAATDIKKRYGEVDLLFVGGDTMSDYPYWNQSCAMPRENFEAMREKLVKSLSPVAKDGKVMYIAGNHDYALGELAAEGKNDVYNSADYYSYPMKEDMGELSEGDSYWGTCTKLDDKTGSYLLAYHYTVNGYHFIGINPHPDEMFYDNEGFYDKDTVKWVSDKIDEIDPDGKTPVFVLGHFSTYTRCNGQVVNTVSYANAKMLDEAFDGHRNLFYFYGHVHGETYEVTSYTAEAVLHRKAGVSSSPIRADTNVTSSREVLPNDEEANYTLVHMGGLRPFDRENFKDDAIEGYGGNTEKSSNYMTATPKLAQYMVFNIYEDRVEFQMYNAGSAKGYSRRDIPKPYTVYFRK